MKYLFNRNLFFLSGLITILLSSFTVGAQTQLSKTETQELLKKIDGSLSNIKTVVYKIDYHNKYLSGRDTLHTTAVCSLYRAPKDKMKVYNIVDLEFTELGSKTYGHRRYDGKKTFWANYPVDSLAKDVKPAIDSKKRLVESIVNNYSHLLLDNYLSQKKPFGVYESSAEMILVTEEIYNNIPAYVLVWGTKEPDDICGEVEGIKKHIVRKSDYLPIAYVDVLKCENMIQYNRAEIEYLEINPDLSLEDFKVDENDTINATERYRVLKERVEGKTVN